MNVPSPMPGGALANLAHEVLTVAGVHPFDDPRILVCRAVELPALRQWLAPNPLCRAGLESPPWEYRNGVISFRHERDARQWGHHVRLGFAHVLLRARDFDERMGPRLAGWLALPDPSATLDDCEEHPYAPADFLRAEVSRRMLETSGVYRLRRRAG